MDFLICKKACCEIRPISRIDLDIDVDSVFTGIKDIRQALSLVRDIASETRVGIMVALFTRDAKPLCGWKVMEEDKLEYMDVEVVQDNFRNISPVNFNLAKRQDEIRKVRFQTSTS